MREKNMGLSSSSPQTSSQFPQQQASVASKGRPLLDVGTRHPFASWGAWFNTDECRREVVALVVSTGGPPLPYGAGHWLSRPYALKRICAAYAVHSGLLPREDDPRTQSAGRGNQNPKSEPPG